MNPASTIRSAINNYMKKESLNLRQFAEKIGINVGTLSYILNGSRNITIEQLDLITEGLGENKGFFYYQYFEEVLIESTTNWRRIKPFLYGCAEIGDLDLIHKAVGLLLDNLMYSQVLFEIAEDFYKNNKKEVAVIIYENVALSEKNQHSERLALCQYRLFMCRLKNDQEKNYQTAIQFELFVDRLDGYEQLEALKDLANTYRSLCRWDKVEEFAERLKNKAELIYYHNTATTDLNLTLVRPLFTYIAYSNLLLGSIYETRGNYVAALQYINMYSNLDWVKENDENSQVWKNKFIAWARINGMVTRLSAGDLSVLPDYLLYMESNKGEVLLSLLNIVSAANRYRYNIDGILIRYDICQVEGLNYDTDTYTRQTIEERFARLYYELAYYYLNYSKFKDGFAFIIKSLEKCTYINEKSCIIKCVGLFESYRDHCDKDILTAYKKIIEGVYENEEKVSSILIN